MTDKIIPRGSVEHRQERLQKNGRALERELGRLLRVANRIEALRKERKRLMKPPRGKASANWTPDKHGLSGSASDDGMDDGVPIL